MAVNIYNEYVNQFEEFKKDLEDEIKDYNSSKDVVFEFIKEHELYLKNFTNHDFKHLKDLDNYSYNHNYVKKDDIISEIELGRLKRSIRLLIEINRRIKNTQKEILEYNRIFKKPIMLKILKSFNEKISDDILYRAYSFSPAHGIGTIRIRKVIYNKPRKKINWGESNKKRKELEAEGIQIYKVLKRDENNKALEVQEGEKWFKSFESSIDYFWFWNKRRCFIENRQYYRFLPTKHDNTNRGKGYNEKKGNIKKLADLKSSNAPILSSYRT